MNSRNSKSLALFSALVVGSMMASVAQASVIFHDGIDYTPGTSLRDNSGWMNQHWAGGSDNVSATGLTYPGLTTTGGSVNMYQWGDFSNITPPTSFYVSVLINKTNTSGVLGVIMQQGWNQATVTGFGIDGTNIFASDGGYANFGATYGTAVTTGTTALLVAYVDGTAHTITAWDYANPTNTATYAYSNTTPIGTVEIYSSWSGAGLVDEITVGTELADVTPVAAPEPASLGLLASGALMLLRRRRTH